MNTILNTYEIFRVFEKTGNPNIGGEEDVYPKDVRMVSSEFGDDQGNAQKITRYHSKFIKFEGETKKI